MIFAYWKISVCVILIEKKKKENLANMFFVLLLAGISFGPECMNFCFKDYSSVLSRRVKTAKGRRNMIRKLPLRHSHFLGMS